MDFIQSFDWKINEKDGNKNETGKNLWKKESYWLLG